MNDETNNFENKILQINKKLDNLVSLIDKKPNFYNNIFFEENSKSIPLNLINLNYININHNKDIIKNSLMNSNYNLKEPMFLFSLPSSDDSENEDITKIQHNSFKSICDNIIDTDYLKIIENKNEKEEEELNEIPKDILPILMFKSTPEISSINEIIKISNFKTHIKPYEIKKYYFQETKDEVFLVKYHSLKDAIKAKTIFEEEYDNKFHLIYDERESKDSEWYCIIFRRECIKDKNNYKFKDIINEIYENIKCKEKKIISFDINNNPFIKDGNIFYSAIRVDNLNEAINLCLKYNNFNSLKVHLHYLTYQNSKKIFPKVLTQKNFLKETKISLNKGPDSKIYKRLFPFNKNKHYKSDH